MAKKRIKDLKRYGKKGWEWYEYEPYADLKGYPQWIAHNTNQGGKGLWKAPNGKQVLGTTQFELPSDKKKAYAKIYREYLKNHGK